ncbi:hypothetical protein D1872_218490 [compost metagenome]
MQEGVISSKKEGGEWGLKTLSQDFHITIRKCLDRYSGLEQEIELDQSQALQFADYMLKEITSNRELLLGGDNPANSRY